MSLNFSLVPLTCVFAVFNMKAIMYTHRFKVHSLREKVASS